jgi:hypothetical protein
MPKFQNPNLANRSKEEKANLIRNSANSSSRISCFHNHKGNRDWVHGRKPCCLKILQFLLKANHGGVTNRNIIFADCKGPKLKMKELPTLDIKKDNEQLWTVSAKSELLHVKIVAVNLIRKSMPFIANAKPTTCKKSYK